jgi:uncharacterized protein (DUF4415 family)
MKSKDSSAKLPSSPKEWEEVIAAAPGKHRPLTAKEKKQWDNAVVVDGGGYKAVRAAVAAKRKQGERGPQRSATKQLVSVRYSPEVLTYFKASGAGWQTRMDDALKQWVSKHSKSGRAASEA